MGQPDVGIQSKQDGKGVWAKTMRLFCVWMQKNGRIRIFEDKKARQT